MLKISQLVSVLILCLAPCAHPLAGIAQAGESPEVASVAGTEWVGMDNPEKLIVTYRFENGGVLAYRYGGTSYRNGTWKQDGRKVYFEMNNKFRETEATLDGEVITGASQNIRGDKWQTTIYKYEKPK